MNLRNDRCQIFHRALAAVALIFVAPALLAANLVSDGFSTDQGPLYGPYAPGPLTDFTPVNGTGMAGSSRDLPATLQFNLCFTDGSASIATLPGTGLIPTDPGILVPIVFFGGEDFIDLPAAQLLTGKSTNGLDNSFDFLQTSAASVPAPSAVFIMGSALFGLGLGSRRTDQG